MATESCFLRTAAGWIEIEADGEGVTDIRFLDTVPVRSAFAVSFPHLKEAYKQVGEYFRGERSRFNMKLNPKGLGLEQQLWKRLAEVAGYRDEQPMPMNAPAAPRDVIARAQ